MPVCQGEYYITGHNGCKDTYTSDDIHVVVEDVREDVADAEAVGSDTSPTGGGPGTGRGTASWRLLLVGLILVGAFVIWRQRRRVSRNWSGLPSTSPRQRMRP